MKIETKNQIEYELKQNVLDLLYLMHDDDLKVTYENQEHYLELLRLLFNQKFTERILKLRNELSIPKEWSRVKRDDTEEWENWVDTHSEAPKERTDKLILKLCADFNVDPLSFGLFIVDYLYFSAVDSAIQEPVDSYSKEEFKYKAKVIVQTGQPTNNILGDNQQLSAYIQIFNDTSSTGLKDFFLFNQKELLKIQQQLPKYPIPRVRKPEIFKRELEIFLLDALGYSAGDIGNILSGAENKRLLENFTKENKQYFSELPSLSSPEKVMKIISKRNKDEIYALNDSTITAIISNFKNDLNSNKY